jgi:sucrose-6-phosphate hydrolase SacC (GH32 family)
MFAEPVIELERLHGGRKLSWYERTIKAGSQEFDSVCPELCEIRAVFVPGSAEVFGLTVRGQTVEYNEKMQMLSCKGRNVPLKLREGKLALRIFVDRGSIEVFGNLGEAALSVGVRVPEKERSLTVFSRGGETTLRSLKAIELKSAWPKP